MSGRGGRNRVRWPAIVGDRPGRRCRPGRCLQDCCLPGSAVKDLSSGRSLGAPALEGFPSRGCWRSLPSRTDLPDTRPAGLVDKRLFLQVILFRGDPLPKWSFAKMASSHGATHPRHGLPRRKAPSGFRCGYGDGRFHSVQAPISRAFLRRRSIVVSHRSIRVFGVPA
jgi:hypothetical protein